MQSSTKGMCGGGYMALRNKDVESIDYCTIAKNLGFSNYKFKNKVHSFDDKIVRVYFTEKPIEFSMGVVGRYKTSKKMKPIEKSISKAIKLVESLEKVVKGK